MAIGKLRKHKRGNNKRRQRKPQGLLTVTDAGFKNFLASNRAILPTRIKTKLMYTERVVLSVAAGVVQTVIFRGNSVFQPKGTGGTKPTGFSELATFYERYVVTASKCELIVISDTPNPASAIAYSLIPVVNSTIYTAVSPDLLSEKPYAIFKVMVPQTGISTCSQYMSTMKQFGKPRRDIISDDIFDAAVTGNPTSTWFWQVTTRVIDRATTQDAFMYVKLTYYVEFFMPKNLLTS